MAGILTLLMMLVHVVMHLEREEQARIALEITKMVEDS
jgi:hypothetical protein